MTLDDDVADRIASEARRTGRPYRVVVNDAIRRGLEAPIARQPLQIRAGNMGLRPGLDLDDIEGLLDRLDGPLRR